MGIRGPKPNPQSGRSRKRGIVATSAKGKIPKRPSSLGPAGADLWSRIVRGLKDRKAVGSLHLYSLTAACKLADEIDSLERNIATHGLTYVGPNAAECLRPEVKQLNTVRRQMQFYEKEFGLTCAADERLRGAPLPEKQEDPFDVLSKMGATRN